LEGTMDITGAWLKKNKADKEFQQWFKNRFHQEAQQYSNVIDSLAAEGKREYAEWLNIYVYTKQHATSISGDIISDGDVYFGGDLNVAGSIDITGDLLVGRNVAACGYIKIGGKIKTLGNITSNLYIMADGDIGALASINAGLFITTANGKITAGYNIRAGEEIYSKKGIQSGGNIEAGKYITSETFIRAGAEFGIYAGTGIARKMESYATITAAQKPDNIVIGRFVKQSLKG